MRETWAIRRFSKLVLTVLLVPPSLLLAYSIYRQHQDEIKNIDLSSLSLARTGATETVALLDDARYILDGLARRPLIRALDPDHCDPTLQDLRDWHRDFANLSTIDRTGQVICNSSARPGQVLPNYSQHEWFPRVTASKSFLIGAPVVGGTTKLWVVPIVQPLLDDRGNLAGVLSLTMNLASFKPRFIPQELPAGTEVTIIDSTGTYVARSTAAEAWLGKRLPNQQLLTTALNNQSSAAISSRFIDTDGLDYVAGFARVPGTNWLVIATIPLQTILSGARNIAMLNIMAVALALGIAIGAAAYFIRKIERPIFSIAASARAHMRGDPTARAAEDGPTEIVTVARQFNLMLDAARQAGEELLRQKRQLDAATNNMSQGLAMFDASGTLIVRNERLLQIYGLSTKGVRPGSTFRDFLVARAAAGTFSEDVDALVANVAARVAQGATTRTSSTLSDGRVIIVVNQPMAGGGWVTTHEDVTDSMRREDSFRLLFKNNPVPMWVFDRGSLRFLAVNAAAERHYGYSRDQFMAMTIADLRVPEERDQVEQLVRSTQGVFDGERSFRHRKSDGTTMDVAIYSRALDYEGRPAGLVASLDITERRLAEDELRRAKAFYGTVIENIPIPILVKDARELRYMLVNRAGETFFGVSRNEIIGKTARAAFPSNVADVIESNDLALLQSRQPLFFKERWMDTPSNGIRHITAHRIAVIGDDGEPEYLLGVIEDLTERKRAEERITHMAYHDALTDLPNREEFREQLELAVARVGRGEQFALLYLDLDNFKTINDTLGHLIGDELLKAVAARLRNCVRDGDTLARLGGDEFAVIQAGVDQPTDVAHLATRIQAAIGDVFNISNHHLTVSASIGIAMAPANGTAPEVLQKNADMALYSAKADGRGVFRFFELEMDLRMKARSALEFDLRQAIAAGAFELHYQPLVNLRDGKITSCEALLRWRHPKHGMILPDEFIPIAEETGLIIPLGEWVLKTACAEAMNWPNDINVAVNVSPIQFKNQTLSPAVIRALAESGLPARRLELEVTEAVLIRDDEAALRTLSEMQALGVKIAMDDFGTGYSSLSYLHRFAFDKIKIDRSFIKTIADKEGSLAIVQAVISIAKSLHVSVVAEGVETEQQLQALRRLGCAEMQGFLFCRPAPAAGLSRIFSLHRERPVDAA